MRGPGPDQTISVEALPLGSDSVLTLVDGDGVIQYKNSTGECVLGYSQDELRGTHITEHVYPDDRERVSEMLKLLINSRKQDKKRIEYRYETPDGTYEWVTSVGSSQPTDDGWYAINTRAVTNRNVSDEHRTGTEHDLGKFAKVVSHDLRNPLNVASGHVTLLYEELGGDHSDHREQLQKVMNAHDRMETLIQNLLAIAQSGKEVDEVEWVTFSELCQRCWRNVSTANAEVVIEFDGEVRADISRLQQLVENLIRNAIEHGGEDVTVTIGETNHDGFYIADNGSGIPESIQDQLFQNGFSTVSEGTGFGLWIVSEVANAHGWEVAITESEDDGARFEITGIDQR